MGGKATVQTLRRIAASKDQREDAESVRLAKSDAFAAIHESMAALHEIGAIDKRTMRDFAEACLEPARVFAPEEIRALRTREHLSQGVFARYLNVSKNLVSDWERGVKKPGGPALRLLTIIEKKGVEAVV